MSLLTSKLIKRGTILVVSIFLYSIVYVLFIYLHHFITPSRVSRLSSPISPFWISYTLPVHSFHRLTSQKQPIYSSSFPSTFASTFASGRPTVPSLKSGKLIILTTKLVHPVKCAVRCPFPVSGLYCSQAKWVFSQFSYTFLTRLTLRLMYNFLDASACGPGVCAYFYRKYHG